MTALAFVASALVLALLVRLLPRVYRHFACWKTDGGEYRDCRGISYGSMQDG